MIDKSYAAWMRAGMDTWALGIEASAVVGLRVAKFASGGDLDGAEARLMVAEKLASAWEVQAGMIGLTPLAGARRALSHYGGKVSANRRRLSRAR